jgi:hypothetical protein
MLIVFMIVSSFNPTLIILTTLALSNGVPKIQQIRKRKGITQDQLAELAGWIAPTSTGWNLANRT